MSGVTLSGNPAASTASPAHRQHVGDSFFAVAAAPCITIIRIPQHRPQGILFNYINTSRLGGKSWPPPLPGAPFPATALNTHCEGLVYIPTTICARAPDLHARSARSCPARGALPAAGNYGDLAIAATMRTGDGGRSDPSRFEPRSTLHAPDPRAPAPPGARCPPPATTGSDLTIAATSRTGDGGRGDSRQFEPRGTLRAPDPRAPAPPGVRCPLPARTGSVLVVAGTPKMGDGVRNDSRRVARHGVAAPPIHALPPRPRRAASPARTGVRLGGCGYAEDGGWC
ncbi:hypothetical protein C8F04DRAFT_1266689 [Mycena alexandri]|uniref:Uncharacterized protein n=1 Tax=Mycena alexandri TaxID=1745969 RepID=A0AAD6WWY9_9AGAR|nr:hypothetical protein C8F04DRAFT_1266689 [Mycena alexandri]